jgi:hypothetical protein
MSKRKDRSAEQPPRLFRAFNDYPVEDVMKVAVALYTVAPFKRELWGETLRWHSLVRRAFDFLDNLHSAYEHMVQFRRARDAAYRRAEQRIAEAANLKLPEMVRVEKGVRIIIGNNRTALALHNFRTLVRYLPRYFGGLFGEPHTPEALFEHWRKNGGIPRDEVIELRELYQDTWPLITAKMQSEKARKRKH